MFDIIFHLIVNTVRKTELTDVIKYAAVPFAELPDLRRSVPRRNDVESGSDRVPKHSSSQSPVRGVSTHDGGVAYVAQHVHEFRGGAIKMGVIILGRGVFV